MNIKIHKKVLGFLIAFALLCFLGRVLVLNWKAVGNASWHFHLPWLVASFGMNVLYSGLLVKPWLAFLKQLGKALTYREGFQICYLSKWGRYLPGRIWGLLGQVYLCRKAGIGPAEALFSTVLELGFLTLSGIVMSLGSLPFLHGWNGWFLALLSPHPSPRSVSSLLRSIGERGWGRGWLIPLFLLLFVVGIFTLAHFGGKLFRFVSRKVLRTDIPFQFSFFQFLRFLLTYLLLWCCCGLAFFLFVKSLSPLGWHQFPAMMGIYATAWTVGFLSMVTPGGLGIREGVLSVLLSAYLPPATATLVALLSRIWSLAADGVLAGCAFCLRWKTNKTHAFIRSCE